MLGLGSLKEWLDQRKYGGNTGLNYVSGQFKEGSIVGIPWLLAYLVIFILVPDPYLEVSIILMSIGWVVGTIGYYMWVRMDATRFRCFPQALWRFPDGGSRKYDMKIHPENFIKECDFTDGSEGWRWNLGEKFQYHDRRSPFPFVFDYALIHQPKKPDECFGFLSEGELFHKGMMISNSACENISVFVFGWTQDPTGAYVPVGTLNDCTLKYEESLVKGKLLGVQFFSKRENYKMMYEHERQRRMVEGRHMKTLEDAFESDVEDSKDFRKNVDTGMSRARDLYHTIMDTDRPLMQRLKSKVAWILIALVILFGALWFAGLLPF